MTTKYPLGETQQCVLDYLCHAQTQITTKTLATALKLNENSTRQALRRLFERGMIYRSTTYPAKWFVQGCTEKVGDSSQIVVSPPTGSAGSIHDSMPEA